MKTTNNPFSLAEYASISHNLCICCGTKNELVLKNLQIKLSSGEPTIKLPITSASCTLAAINSVNFIILAILVGTASSMATPFAIGLIPLFIYDRYKYFQLCQRHNNLQSVRSIISPDKTTPLTTIHISTHLVTDLLTKLVSKEPMNLKFIPALITAITSKYKISWFSSNNSADLIDLLNTQSNVAPSKKATALSDYINNKKNHGNRLFKNIIEVAKDLNDKPTEPNVSYT